jgi:hypothetical protein
MGTVCSKNTTTYEAPASRSSVKANSHRNSKNIVREMEMNESESTVN